MGNALGEQFKDPGALAGMKGTTPLTDLSADFKKRLKAVNPELEGLTTTPVSPTTRSSSIALAAQAAGTNDANTFEAYINGLTFGGDKCTDYAACLKILKAGGNVDYDGVAGPLSFADAGEPAVASFGLLQFGDDNKLDDSKTKFVIAGDEANAATDEGPAVATTASGGPLVIGTLLPLTGILAFLGPPEVAGTQLAIQDINAAGGALASPSRSSRVTPVTPRPTRRSRRSTACCSRTSTRSSVRRPRR